MITLVDTIRRVAPARWRAADRAPSTEAELFGRAGSDLVVWAGASGDTVWGDPALNWAFRAAHDAEHLRTGVGFSPLEEVELARRSVSAWGLHGLAAEVVYAEVAGQALEFLRTGEFVTDQRAFTLAWLAGVDAYRVRST